MSSGPPSYPQEPQRARGGYPGQQTWAAYPGFGAPPPPPPKKGGGLVWAVLGVVVVLVAAGVTTYFLAFHDPGGGEGGDVAQSECDGDYCVGEFPYANACGVLSPSSVAARVGAIGGDGLFVQESYADPLPSSEGDRLPAWTYGLRSRCDVSPRDRERAAFRSVTVELVQTARAAEKPAKGSPLPGFDGALVEHSEGRAAVTWARANITATLDVTWTNRKPAISDATLATAARSVDDALANPPGPPGDLGDLSANGKRVVNDACEVFTGADFQAATKYAVSPLAVKRTYHTGSGARETSCARTTASANNGIPAAEGATFLDGAMAPTVRVSELRDPAAARARFADERARVGQAQDVPRIGDAAVYGIRDSSAFTLKFVSGVHLVSVDCGLSNGNSDWTPADMRERLEPLAKAVAGRMP